MSLEEEEMRAFTIALDLTFTLALFLNPERTKFATLFMNLFQPLKKTLILNGMNCSK